ncbi:hypothetical protein N658DRAFT_322745 [Parathielavia hyrcaniae]|uniref:Uncharacterized protein n=1 Tax=Parathielavia hyrcaniae TaxID=113614 RepID=A0AAN6Q3C7_9PEZI|nr:hypothetical protein N658DRAFT_322745 [Parathielavia hyrcaniae]
MLSPDLYSPTLVCSLAWYMAIFYIEMGEREKKREKEKKRKEKKRKEKRKGRKKQRKKKMRRRSRMYASSSTLSNKQTRAGLYTTEWPVQTGDLKLGPSNWQIGEVGGQ